MATATTNYDTSNIRSLTVTLTSLANGSWRQSTSQDNDQANYYYIDCLLGGSIQVGTSPTAGGTIDIYVYGSYDNSSYTGGASGTDGSYTADGEEDLFPHLISIEVDATSDQDYVFGPISIAQAFGGVVPPLWGIVVENNTGATLNATGTNNEVQYTGIKYDSA